jgi:F0F1-type ATP synthase assembly protein I
MFHFKDREIKSKINRKEENKSNRAGRQAENKIDTSLIGGIWRGIVYGI